MIEKVCDHCKQPLPMEAFPRRKTKDPTDGRAKTCNACLALNREEQIRICAARHAQREREERERVEALAREREREREERRQPLIAWAATQPDRVCTACHETKKAIEFCLWDDAPIPPTLYTRCKPCHEAYRQNNRQVNPLCPMCEQPVRHTHGGWLREYQGHKLDIIKVCCTACIPQFEAMPESEQIALLRQAMIKTYGETAVIYGLRYDDSFHCHHIGRTKRLKRRMAEYRQYWDKPIQAYHVLEEIPFGPLSMERESRWILHALKAGWPIDNFEMHTIERRTLRRELGWWTSEHPIEDSELGERERETKARLIQEVANIEPLTCPFEVIAPIIRSGFMNVTDMGIVHWLVSLPNELKAMCAPTSGSK